MRCPNCSAANVDQAGLCRNCGASPALACPYCGAELPPQARFCTACGTPSAASVPDPFVEAVKRLVLREYAALGNDYLGHPGAVMEPYESPRRAAQAATAALRDLSHAEVAARANDSGCHHSTVRPVSRRNGGHADPRRRRLLTAPTTGNTEAL